MQSNGPIRERRRVLQNLSIIFVAVFVCAAERTLPTKRTFFCICLAFFGVWLIATGGRLDGMELTAKGLFWGIMGGVGAAAYSCFQKSGESVGKYSCNRDGNVYRRRVYIGSVRIWKVPAELDGHAASFIWVCL